MTRFLDRLTGGLTMYRLVLGSLIATSVVAFVLSIIGVLAYGPLELFVSAVVAVVTTVASGWLFARAFRTRAHLESSLITGLILFMLFLPSLEPRALLALALAATIASASKFLLAVRGRHIVNPAAAGAVVLGVLQWGFAGWWVATASMLPVVAFAAFLILFRTRTLTMGLVFVLVAATLVTARSGFAGTELTAAVSTAFASYPILFLAGFMLSEPLTLAPRRWQRLVVAALVGVLFAVPFAFPPVYSSPELALILGNLVAFAFGQRRGIRLTFVGMRQLTSTIGEFAFLPSRPVSFSPGQYMELQLPHSQADARGSRRFFSISAPPSADGPITFAMTLSEPSSSFKTAMRALQPGDSVRGTLVGGDFLLPTDRSIPVLLIAGGIGITPFASQLAHAHRRGERRDVTVIYSVRDADELAYAETLTKAGVSVVLIAPTLPPRLPANWTYAGPHRLHAESVRSLVPDVATRRVFISGSPALIGSVTPVVRAAGAKRITTDIFSGY